MIKAVVFDLGKVLVDFDYSIAANRLLAQCTLTLPEIARAITGASIFVEYETGLISTDDFFKGMCAATGYRGSLEEFGDAFADIFTEIEPMVEIQTALRKRGIPT